MITRRQKEQLLQLRMLSYLQEPAQREFGARGKGIARHCQEDGRFKGVQADVILGGMLADELVERRQDPADKRSQLYFITDKGDRFHEEKVKQAIFPESATETNRAETNWTDHNVRTSIYAALSDRLGTFPEFANSPGDRIREVAFDLTGLIEETVSRMR